MVDHFLVTNPEKVARVMYQAYIDHKWPELVDHPDPTVSNSDAFDRTNDSVRSHWLAVAEAVMATWRMETE